VVAVVHSRLVRPKLSVPPTTSKEDKKNGTALVGELAPAGVATIHAARSASAAAARRLIAGLG
jgi:hypothetical protein